MLVQCDCIVWVLELVCVIWVTNSMLFYHPLSFYFEIMVLLQQHHLSTFKWHCWCQCLKTRLKHLTLEWKLARRESSWLWMQLVWERALYKIQETTWRNPKQHNICRLLSPNQMLTCLCFYFCWKVCLAFCDFCMTWGLRNASLSQNATACFRSLLPGCSPFFQPPPTPRPQSCPYTPGTCPVSSPHLQGKVRRTSKPEPIETAERRQQSPCSG